MITKQTKKPTIYSAMLVLIISHIFFGNISAYADLFYWYVELSTSEFVCSNRLGDG